MYILVNGTKVIAWDESPIEGDGVPFNLDEFTRSEPWPGAPATGLALHWDGAHFWTEPDAYDPEQTLAAIFLSVPSIVEAIPDNDIAHMAPYIQDWAPDTPYVTGDVRAYDNLVYRCLQPHTSQESWNPADAPSLWARVLSGQDGEVGVWEQPESTNPYMKGNRVYYPTEVDSVYESDIDNNVWPPNVYGWHLVYTPVTPEPEPEPEPEPQPEPEPEPEPEPQPEIPEWVQPDSTNPYMSGDHVMHNGVEWVSAVDNNVWEPGVYGWDMIGESGE